MGWSSGSSLFSRVSEIIGAVVHDTDDKREIYEELIAVFEDFDCDTLEECLGVDSVLDEVLKEIYDIEDEEDEKDEEDDWPDGGREDFS